MGRKWLNLSGKDGKTLPEYTQWSDMLLRATKKFQLRYSTYAGCSVEPAWENYDNYYSWAETQVGFLSRDGKGKLFNLDKDLLVKGNKLYSSETCVFIPHELNGFLLTQGNNRGLFPIGVSKSTTRGRFLARIRHSGRKHSLGTFTCPDEAHKVYCEAKESIAKELAVKYQGLVDQRVIDALNQFKVQ